MPQVPRSAAAVLLLLIACSPGRTPALAEGQLPVAGGDSLYFRLVGTGPDTVVVLHGGPALNSRYLEEALRPLAESHVLLFYDQRGRGRSTTPHLPDSLSFTRDLDDLAAVQAHFALGPLRVVGHHWGAALAALYAIHHPGQIARMVLLSPLVHQSAEVFPLSQLPNDSTAFADLARARVRHADSTDPVGFCTRFWGFAFSPAEITTPAVIRQLAPAVCSDTPARLADREAITRRLFVSLGRWAWIDSLSLALPPALIITGSDTPPLLTDARLWAGHLHHARMLVLGRVALVPWFDATEAMNQALDVFLRGSWPVRAVRIDSLGQTITAS